MDCGGPVFFRKYDLSRLCVRCLSLACCCQLDCLPLKIHTLKSYPPVPQNVTLFGDKGGLYRDKQVKMRSLVWAVIKYDSCPYEKGIFGHKAWWTQGGHHVKMKAEFKVMCLPGKDGQRLPANYQMLREDYEHFSSDPSGGTSPWHLDLRHLGCRTLRQ